MFDSVALDAQTRELVTTELLENLFVEAGAGTGKTTLLVSRVMALIDEGRSLRSIAAITFTEKAAAELRDRLRATLTERGRRDLLDDLDDATITTIHGFARSILSTHALRAGLPPEIEMVVDVESAAGFADDYARFADRLLSGDVRLESMRRAVALGVTRRNLEPLASALHEQRHRLADWDGQIPDLPVIDVGPVIAALDEALSARHACIGRDKLADFIEGDPLALRGALVGIDDDPVEQLRLLASTPLLPSRNIGRKDQWPPPVDKDTMMRLLQAADRARRAVVDTNVAHVLAVLVTEIAQFVDDTAQRRRLTGRLEFHDLLVEARRLLRDDASVRARVGQQFQHILVDEFQDTGPLQLDLITLITSVDDDAGELVWQDRTLALGGLFAVGDPKQSIYRFRSADVSLYAAAAQVFGGSPLPLTTNFRSTADVLAWINPTIGQLFIGSGVPQAAFAGLDPHRAQPGWGVQVLGIDPLELHADEVRGVEARELASAIVSMVASARLVHGPASTTRPVRFADIAVLLPTRTSLGALEVALEAAGVPFRVESRSLVFATDEVRTLANVLRALDDPGDEVAVVAALRSTAFACSDAALVRWKQAGGRWNPLASIPEAVDAHDIVAQAMAWLAELHHRRHWHSVPELVDLMVTERHLVEVALAHRRPRDHWRRLEIVAEQALAYDRVGGRSLRAFVDWMDAQRLGGASDTESITPDLDDDAVRVMTVHAAKGLEFPIVVMAGLSAEPNNFPPSLLWGDDGRPVVRIGGRDLGLRSAEFEDALTLDKTLDRAEADRLLYVAATRARDALVVCLHRPVKGAESHAHRLADALAASAHWRHFEALPPATVVADDPLGQSALPFLPDRQAWRERRAKAKANGERSSVVSATAVNDLRAGGSETEQVDEADEVRPPWRRGRAGTSIGRAVHAVLQTVDLSGEGVDHGAWLQAQAEGIGEYVDDVARLVRAVLASRPVSDARAGRSWREVYVAAPVGDVVIEGFVDLLVERPDGSLLVVDYKTDAAANQSDIDEAVARYRLQVAAYALAVGQQLGRPVESAALVFARARGDAATVDIDDLPAAIAEVRQRCGVAPVTHLA